MSDMAEFERDVSAHMSGAQERHQRYNTARFSPIRPEAAQLVLWAAGGRFMKENEKSSDVLRIGGEYLGRILDRVDTAIAERAEGFMLGSPMFAARHEIRAEYGDPEYIGVDAPVRPVSGLEALAFTATDAYKAVDEAIGEAYHTYAQYWIAEAQHAGQTDVNWH